MSSDVYCTREDLYRYGLPRGLLANPGRLVAAVYPSTDIFELDGHGFGDAESGRTAVLFRAEAGGSLPAELTAGTTYYAEFVTDSTFQAYADAIGGSPINLSTAGSGIVVSTKLPIDEVSEYYSRFVDDFLPAHAVPLTPPYPVRVSGVVAELVATRLLIIAGQKSGTMNEIELAAKAQLERWAKGLPLRDARATIRANLSYSGNATGGRQWGPGGGTLP